MFYKRDETGYQTPVEGVRQKTIAYGARTLMTEFRIARGGQIPSHRHDQEQTGYVVTGNIRLRVGAAERACLPGDAWCIPGGVLHAAEALEDTVVIEVFSPVRKDYLPEGEA